MRPGLWHPPIELSVAEQKIVKLIKRAKLFVFLRQTRHELFDEAFQQALAEMYADKPKGHPPVAPALLCLAIILQAYTGASDDEAIEALVMDRRWQLVLDCLDCEQAPFAKGTLVEFRALLIQHEMDRQLVERTIALAQTRGGFSSRSLRAALDSSPLWGAGKVEDTYNLLGHALKKALSVLARQQGRELTELATAANVPMLGASSVKVALDLNWDDPQERQVALVLTLQALSQVETWITEQALPPSSPPTAQVQQSLAIAQQIVAQDVETRETGTVQLKQAVSKDRRISIEDAQMRHGRKSKHQRVDGYKRHLLSDLDCGLIRAVGVTPANRPEASVTDALSLDIKKQQIQLSELYIDRADLSSSWVKHRTPELTIYCKAWPVRIRTNQFPKTAFTLDWDAETLTCPNHIQMPLRLGQTIHFPKARCAACPLKEQCTSSKQGRSVTIHPDEPFLNELRQRQLSPQGRAKLRERTAVEHALAHVGHWQGDQARYIGLRKNLFDLRRMAIIHNLHVIARLAGAPQNQAS